MNFGTSGDRLGVIHLFFDLSAMYNAIITNLLALLFCKIYEVTLPSFYWPQSCPIFYGSLPSLDVFKFEEVEPHKVNNQVSSMGAQSDIRNS